MARVAGKLLLLQIVCILCFWATAQFEDIEDFKSSGSGSGDASNPTFVDYEEDYTLPFPYIPEEVDICDTYPLGMCIIIIA
jgi:hypothetical protein